MGEAKWIEVISKREEVEQVSENGECPDTLCKTAHNSWCWARPKAGGEGGDRGWGGWLASPTWWTCVWARSGSWWCTGRPGVLQPVGSQRVVHDWAAELNLVPTPKPDEDEKMGALRVRPSVVRVRWADWPVCKQASRLCVSRGHWCRSRWSGGRRKVYPLESRGDSDIDGHAAAG